MKSCHVPSGVAAAASLILALAACGGGGGGSRAVVTGASLASCSALATTLSFPNTSFTAASVVSAGTLKVGGNPVPADCQVTGKMFHPTDLSALKGRGASS